MEKIVNIHRNNLPEWFLNAHLGIFIHWGLYSVPAYAPVEVKDFHSINQEESADYLFKNQPYAEWYKNSMMIPGSPVAKYHQEHYGNQPYENFAKEFKETAREVDVEKWADSFVKAGAKYVVIVTKHHDGFVLYDTKVVNPYRKDYHLDFDFVGDLAQACRKRGLKFGVYYSSLLDWTFTKKPVTDLASFMLGNNNKREYTDYAFAQWQELIDRYQPDILWSDIGYPSDNRLEDLFHYYYKKVPGGIVNDRWNQFPNFLRNPLGKKIFNILAKRVTKKNNENGEELGAKYYDYRTIEYTTEWKDTHIPVEMCRGMDKSFGYNQYSSPKDYITTAEVVNIISDLVPKNGRLLLNVGPKKDGSIPAYQQGILEELSQRKF